MVQGDFEWIVTYNYHEISVVRNNLSKKTKTGKKQGRNQEEKQKKTMQ